jgi:hypothetical protein
MTYAHAKIIKVLEACDGKARVNILERKDGLYEFRAYVERYEEYPNEREPYWSPTAYSGLYAVLEDAERDALNEVLVFDAKSKTGH